jgi:hypothetical protein
MPKKLSTTVTKIRSIPNKTNTTTIEEFHKYMKDNDSSDRHQNNALKVVIAYAKYLGSDITFYDISHTKNKSQGFLIQRLNQSNKILTKNVLLHGITIYIESNI